MKQPLYSTTTTYTFITSTTDHLWMLVLLVALTLATTIGSNAFPMYGDHQANESDIKERLILGGHCALRSTCNQRSRMLELDSAGADKRPCYCDELCAIYDDCCMDSTFTNSFKQRIELGDRRLKEARRQWHCHKVNPIFGDILLKASCASDWLNASTGDAQAARLVQRRCEYVKDRGKQASMAAISQADPVGMMMPITDLSSGITYANSYCLRCNRLNMSANRDPNKPTPKLIYWFPLLDCNYNLDKDNRNQLYDLVAAQKGKVLRFCTKRGIWVIDSDPNKTKVSTGKNHKTCKITPTIPDSVEHIIRYCRSRTIDTCPPILPNVTLSEEDKQARLECLIGHQSLIYSQTSDAVYYNLACAKCNKEEQVFCQPRTKKELVGSTQPNDRSHVTLYSLSPAGDDDMIDMDSARSSGVGDHKRTQTSGSFSVLMDLYGTSQEDEQVGVVHQCSEAHNQVYDPFFLTCRDVVCGLNHHYVNGKCVAGTRSTDYLDSIHSQLSRENLSVQTIPVGNNSKPTIVHSNSVIPTNLANKNSTSGERSEKLGRVSGQNSMVASIDTKPEPISGSPEPTPSKPDLVSSKPEPIDTKSEPIDAKPEPIDTKPEPIDSRPEPIDSKPEPVDIRPEPTAPEPVEGYYKGLSTPSSKVATKNSDHPTGLPLNVSTSTSRSLVGDDLSFSSTANSSTTTSTTSSQKLEIKSTTAMADQDLDEDRDDDQDNQHHHHVLSDNEDDKPSEQSVTLSSVASDASSSTTVGQQQTAAAQELRSNEQAKTSSSDAEWESILVRVNPSALTQPTPESRRQFVECGKIRIIPEHYRLFTISNKKRGSSITADDPPNEPKNDLMVIILSQNLSAPSNEAAIRTHANVTTSRQIERGNKLWAYVKPYNLTLASSQFELVRLPKPTGYHFDLLICSPFRTDLVDKFKPPMAYLTFFCLIISITSLALYLSLYCLSMFNLRHMVTEMAYSSENAGKVINKFCSEDKFRGSQTSQISSGTQNSSISTASRSQNLSSRGVACLAASLLAAYLLFMLGHQATTQYSGPHSSEQFSSETVALSCMIIAILTYYCFLVAFNWMFLLSYDIWRTLKLATCQLRGPVMHSQSKRFITYMLFALLSAALIVGASVLIDQIPLGCEHDSDLGQVEQELTQFVRNYRPKFGQRAGSCWFSNRRALALFFGFPVTLIMIVNLLFFFHSSCMVISTSSRSSRYMTDGKRPAPSPKLIRVVSQVDSHSSSVSDTSSIQDFSHANSMTTCSILSVQSVNMSDDSSGEDTPPTPPSEGNREHDWAPGRKLEQRHSTITNNSIGTASIAASLATRYDSHLHNIGSMMGSVAKDYRLYCRLSTIMGLTWLTGLMASVVGHSDVLWYLFVVLNTLQGLFIFIAFGCKRSKLTNLIILLNYIKFRWFRLRPAKHKKDPQQDDK